MKHYEPLLFKHLNKGTVIYIAGTQQYGLIIKSTMTSGFSLPTKMVEIRFLNPGLLHKIGPNFKESINTKLNYNLDKVNWFYVGEDFNPQTVKVLFSGK